MIDSLISAFRILLLNTRTDSWFTFALLLVVRITTFSLLLRSYLIPWLFTALSKHVRIRSFSLWSIRGLYIRAGDRTIRVDRVRWGFSHATGANVKLDGLSIDMGKTQPKSPPPFTPGHRRRLTLADFAPSPMARRLWNLLSSAYALAEPHLRPLIRTCVVAGLRLFIRWLPHVISGLKFEANTTTFTFPDLPGTQVSIEKLTLHATLSFTELEKVIDTRDHLKLPRSMKSRHSYGVAAWRKRFTASFNRSLDRAWGNAQGTASIAVKLHDIGGSMRRVEEPAAPFFRLPGAMDLNASMGFNPREATVDTHSVEVSLNIGDCSLELDTLKLLLKNLKPMKPFPRPDSPSSPLSYFTVRSLTPSTGNISPQPSPPLALSPGIMSPSSPKSPFFDVFSASIRSRRRLNERLRDVKSVSIISVLQHAELKISSVTLATQRKWGQDPYDLKLEDIVLGSSLCTSTSQNPFHKYWMGQSRKANNYDPDAYGIMFSIRQIFIDRRTKLDTMRLFAMETVDFQALVTQWPAPWLVPSPFMCGDPNAPLLAIRGKIGGMEVTERLERLRELVAHIVPPSNAENVTPVTPSIPTPYFQLPRLAFEIEFGTIRGRIICADTAGFPFAVELRNNGFVVSAESSYERERQRNTHQYAPDHDHTPLQLDFKFSLILDPIFVRVRSKTSVDMAKFTQLRSSDVEFLHDPSMISVESFQCLIEGHALAAITSDRESVASVLSTSSIFNIHLSSDAVCFETWSPHVIGAIHQLLSIMPPHEETVPPPVSSLSTPLLDRLPGGVSFTVAVARFVVFTTAPDINPADMLDLSRGLVLRTSLSFKYSSMHSGHVHRFHDLLQRTETRHKLYLPQEPVVDAVSAARASAVTQNASAYVRIRLSDMVLRSAVATYYEADNPFIFERDDCAFDNSEFLWAPSIRVDICLSGKRGTLLSKAEDSCEVSIQIPNFKATFQLAHVYSTMLGIQTIKSIIPPSPPRHPTQHLSSPQLVVRVKVVITTVQVLCILKTQRFAARIDGIEVHAFADHPLSAQLHKFVVWACLPTQSKWDYETGDRWEEFICLQSLLGSLAPAHGNPTISLDGESGRFRIPFGYVFADFITDITVTMKAIRHLAHISAHNQYSPMPSPEPEGPKSIPSISISLRWLCVEAADDSLETKLAVIWRCGQDAAKHRIEREDAFQAKLAAIYQAESEVAPSGSTQGEQDYHFGASHSIPINEARRRLDEVHELDWTLRLQNLRQKHGKSEDAVNQTLRGKHPVRGAGVIPNIVPVAPPNQAPPLFRALLNGLFLTLHRPSFPEENLPDFLYEQGDGLPRETQFSLLVPLHLNLTLSSLHVTLRDYPLPLFSIPPNTDRNTAAWEFDTDLVVAEEMGSELSVDWLDCPVLDADNGVPGAPAFSIAVPKTIMPVKSYANPIVRVTTKAATILSWSVSYTPAIQDVMRVIETLSTAPRDSSPGVGFWDKIKLLFHWSLVATFKGEVRFHMKGSRDPYKLSDEGAGFVLSWKGNTKLLVARNNEDAELIQVLSDSMFIAIPNFEHLYPHNQKITSAFRIPETSKPFRKVCAELRAGVRFGIGFVLERACGNECTVCSGPPFHRKCRHFHFRPHYEIKLEKKVETPAIKSKQDSYNGFRSDFIHLSVSLTSGIRSTGPSSRQAPSSIHLTPKSFAHFWAWCDLFDGALSLPIRQGKYYPFRASSPKFGRHLATLKYRLHVRQLFIMHAYIDESRETWVDGVIPWIGAKGYIEELQADMHQRDEESVVPGLIPDKTKVIRRKPVYAAEVSLKGVDLRALLATFKEPLRQAVEMIAPPQRSNYRGHQDLPSTPSTSVWYDTKDFIEIDWNPLAEPVLHLLPVMACPQFTYFKHNSLVPQNSTLVSKFGLEGSHSCLLGKCLPVAQVQIEIAEKRIEELLILIKSKKSSRDSESVASWEKMVKLLEEYVSHLNGTDKGDEHGVNRSYLMPTDSASPDEWAEFENVYHIHCPKIFMDNTIRDIMMQYYYCSRARKGLEYHMATRAVKFIRDQAEAAISNSDDDIDSDLEETHQKVWGPSATAYMAASALKKILKGDTSKPSLEMNTCNKSDPQFPEQFDPLQGWSEGVSLRKSHSVLLLKPQIVMQGEGSKDALVVAAVQAKLQIFAIMDDSNANDHISGKVMSRSHMALSGLQTFSPVDLVNAEDISVPLEVLIDLRCESNAFDQLVPQTDATFHYDKFNRLRLRNNITCATRPSTDKSDLAPDNHLHDQTDLIRIHIPRFTVSACDEHFQAISHVVRKLVLFSDAAHKTRLEKLETLLFTYDFTDLASAAQVVANLQSRLGEAIEAQRTAEYNHSRKLEGEEGQLELLKLKAHIFLLAEELNFLFDAIKLAQDRSDDHTEKGSLLLHASSSEISWRMLDEKRDLLSKLVVQNINFLWLNRQDSSTANTLSVNNLQAFDGSRHATWTEILSKHDEPANHPLLKRELFLLANWTVLAPVGGITIYELFEISLHPMRLQIDARVGRRIMEYLWPARKHRNEIEDEKPPSTPPKPDTRMSLDSPRTLHSAKPPNEFLVPPLRRLGNSRSFTDLRGSAKDALTVPTIHKLPSSDTLRQISISTFDSPERRDQRKLSKKDDAAEMKTRTSQKSFVLVRISSMNLLLSVVKEGSFECHDARIQTRDLEYRNQTWSFEELVNQFIPSDMGWRGWVKMAFQQPLLPVLPVARELISKTKWIPSSSRAIAQVDTEGPPPRLGRARASGDDDSKLALVQAKKSKSKSPSRGWRKASRRKPEPPLPNITALPLTDEPESLEHSESQPNQSMGRKRVLSLFNRSVSKGNASGSTSTLRPSNGA